MKHSRLQASQFTSLFRSTNKTRNFHKRSVNAKGYELLVKVLTKNSHYALFKRARSKIVKYITVVGQGK